MRTMKDSGIEWIGVIPESWETGQIGQLYTERKEKVSDRDYPPLSVTMKGIVPQLSTAAKTDAHDDRKLVKKGDFAINSRSDRRGSCGISVYDGSVSLINTILCPRNKMNPQYYDWLFHTTMFADEFYKWGHGIVDDLWTTNWSDMKKIGVPVPTLEEQLAISAHLDRQCAHIDNIIEKTKSSIEEYKKLRFAVITQAVTKGVHDDRTTKDSGIEWIGEIPKEWTITKLGRISTLRSGITLGRKIPDNSEMIERPYLRVANVQDGYVDTSTVTSLSVTKEEDNKYRLHKGDVLMTEGGDRDKLGRGCVWDASIEPCLHQNHIFALQTNQNYLNPFYFAYVTASQVGRVYFDITAIKTTNLACTSSSKVSAFIIPLPSIDEQQEIVAYLDQKMAEIDTLIAKKEQFLTELDAYKKSLIYEYVTGKKEVPQT